jgi:hypothetical protein
MTSDEINQLFASAREIPLETAPEQVAGWVGVAAASSTGVLGVASKLKLLIAKKTFLIMGTILSIASLGVIVTMSINSSDLPKEERSEKHSTTGIIVVTPLEEHVEIASARIIAQDSPEVEAFSLPREPLASLVVEKVDNDPLAPRALEPIENDRRQKTHAAPMDADERIVDDFSSVTISGPVNVVLMQGTTPKITLDLDPNLKEKFEMTNKDGELSIGFGKKVKGSKQKSTIYITFSDLNELRFSGVGDVTSEGAIKLNDLSCKISGVGNIDIAMDCSNLDVAFSGVGDLKISGTVDSANYVWSGVGDLKVDDMQSKNVALSLSGIGNAKLHATESLEVNLSGMGDVNYIGSPKTTDFNTSGKGQVKAS